MFSWGERLKTLGKHYLVFCCFLFGSERKDDESDSRWSKFFKVSWVKVFH